MNVDKLREDFAVLQGKDAPVYFDSACVSLKPRQVVEAIRRYYDVFPACAGRSNHRLAEEVTTKVEEARHVLSRHFNAKKDEEIVFTRNTTEAINLVANCLDLKGRTVLTTDKEHNSNLLPWLRLQEQGRARHEVLRSDRNNGFDLDAYGKRMAGGDVGLVAVQQTSNLDGMTTPVRDIVRIAHDAGALVLVDAAQSAGHQEIDVKRLDADFMACSGHKMLGPSGIGMLYGKKVRMEMLRPFMLGGDTVKDTRYDGYELEDLPHRFEAGLQDYAGEIGFGRAVQYLEKVGLPAIRKAEERMNAVLTAAVEELPATVIGDPDPKGRGSIVSFYNGKMNVHEMNLMLNANNIMARSGAFCVHSWFNAHGVAGALRLSSYLYNTEEEAETVARFLKGSIAPLLR